MDGFDEAAKQHMFGQMIDLFVRPEIDRRVDAGTAIRPFPLRAFQVILRDDGPPEVRLNEEVKAIAQVTVEEADNRQVDDPIYASEIGEIQTLELPPDEDPNCAHVTFFVINGIARLAFDFRYNRAIAVRHLETAAEFLESARQARAAGRMAAFADALLSATELTARSIFLTWPDKKFRKKGEHKEIYKRHADFVSVGNADPEHANVYSELRKLRDALRYVTAERVVDSETAQHYLETVEDMHMDAWRRVG